jgi:hypothetical protein
MQFMRTLQPTRLPIPVNEARSLITICDDDVDLARSEALHNYRYAATDNDAAFWFGVVEVLTPSARPQA